MPGGTCSFFTAVGVVDAAVVFVAVVALGVGVNDAAIGVVPVVAHGVAGALDSADVCCLRLRRICACTREGKLVLLVAP